MFCQSHTSHDDVHSNTTIYRHGQEATKQQPTTHTECVSFSFFDMLLFYVFNMFKHVDIQFVSPVFLNRFVPNTILCAGRERPDRITWNRLTPDQPAHLECEFEPTEDKTNGTLNTRCEMFVLSLCGIRGNTILTVCCKFRQPRPPFFFSKLSPHTDAAQNHLLACPSGVVFAFCWSKLQKMADPSLGNKTLVDRTEPTGVPPMTCSAIVPVLLEHVRVFPIPDAVVASNDGTHKLPHNWFVT